MKLTLLVIGKTQEKYLEDGIALYLNRLKHYIGFQIKVIPELKNIQNLSLTVQRQKEAEAIIKHFLPAQYVVLLDEKGKSYSSLEFASFIEKAGVRATPEMVFVIAGPYGADESLKKRADMLLSFSTMTFSHQMIRLFFVEQLYRAFTIIKGEKYHNE